MSVASGPAWVQAPASASPTPTEIASPAWPSPGWSDLAQGFEPVDLITATPGWLEVRRDVRGETTPVPWAGVIVASHPPPRSNHRTWAMASRL